MKKKTVTFRRITAADFHTFFSLDSPGLYLARLAQKADELAGAADAVEAIVLANKVYEMEFQNRVAEALLPFGKTQQYLERIGTAEGQKLVIDTLGEERLEHIFHEVGAAALEQAKIGQKDKKGSATRRSESL